MRITLVISSLAAGGAERVMSTMANYWAEKRWDITLVTLCSKKLDFYQLHLGVRRIALNVASPSRNITYRLINNLRRIRKLRAALMYNSPNVIVSFMDTTNVLTLLATRGMNIPVVVAERTDPRSRSPGRGLSWLRRVCYPQADAVIALSPEAADWLSTFVRRDRIRVIPNPAPRPIDISAGDMGHLGLIGAARCRPTVVAVGRLSREKGFDLLLRAFAQAARGRFEWRLIILGEGGELGALTKLAITLRIEEQVNFMGIVKDVFRVFKTADLFVMSSRYEGFPNALLEAMSCGLPVVSFDCPSGPSQIIRHGMDGILVPPEDVPALADAIEMLMTDDVKRKRLGERAVDVVKRFGLEHVMDTWESVLKSAEKRIGGVSCGDGIAESTHKEGNMTGSSRFDD